MDTRTNPVVNDSSALVESAVSKVRILSDETRMSVLGRPMKLSLQEPLEQIRENASKRQEKLEIEAGASIDTDGVLDIISDDVDIDLCMPRVTFNVGGVIFQTFENTFNNIPAQKIPDFSSHYDLTRGEYFFDRDPEIFRCVLNYWRTGKLHLPLGKCGPSINQELQMWGLEELDIEPCCWNNYNLGLDMAKSLQKLRQDAIQTYDQRRMERSRNECIICCLRLELWHILTMPKYSWVSKVYEWVAIFLAVLAIFSFCASTTEMFRVYVDSPTNSTSNYSSESTSASIHRVNNGVLNRGAKAHPVLRVIDYICLAFFTLELILLILSAPKIHTFIFSFTAVIDVLAILPDYMEFIIVVFSVEENKVAVTDLLRIMRLMRVVRIFRVIRRVPGLWIMIYTLKASYKDLFLMLLFLIVGTLIFGSVIYFVDDNAVFPSIPQSFWWAIVTMTTVGYGDMVPVTPWGQLVASLATVCGVLLIGFTIPSLVNNFSVYSNLVLFDARQMKLLSKKSSGKGRKSCISNFNDESYGRNTPDLV